MWKVKWCGYDHYPRCYREPHWIWGPCNFECHLTLVSHLMPLKIDQPTLESGFICTCLLFRIRVKACRVSWWRFLITHPYIKWCVARLGSKNVHRNWGGNKKKKKNMCSKEIGLHHVQSMALDQGLIVNIIKRDVNDDSITRKIFAWYRIKYSYELQKLRGKWLRTWLGTGDHLTLIERFATSNKWVPKLNKNNMYT